MASSSSSAAATAAPLEVPPLPDKVYLPQRKAKGNIGVGKQYADEVAFQAAVDAARHAKKERAALVKERERVKEQIRERGRDRSGRQRDAEHETDSERRVRQRSEDDAQAAAHADRERCAKQQQARLCWQQELVRQVRIPRHEHALEMCRVTQRWDEPWWRAIDNWLDEHKPNGTEQWWSDFATYARSVQTKQQSLYDAIGTINGTASTDPVQRCKVAAKLIPDK